MIKAKEAIVVARSLIGTPYSELDCINLIKKVIRTAPGGVKDYTTAGTNTLWRSYDAAAKYRDLTWRQNGLAGAQAGMLAFKRSREDVHHVGLVTGEGTVIHSSSAKGKVVETALDGTWQLLGVHRYIKTSSVGEANESEENDMTLYRARIATEKDPLNVRDHPKIGRILGRVAKGTVVDVVSEKDDGWVRIVFNELVGYVSAEYLERIEEAQEEPAETDEDEIIVVRADITIIDSAGNRFKPVGSWRVLVGAVD